MSEYEEMEVAERNHQRRVRDASCGGNGGAGCSNPLCGDCMNTDDEPRDYLDEAQQIAAGTSRLLPERAHLDALTKDRADTDECLNEALEEIRATSIVLGEGPYDCISKHVAAIVDELRSAREDGAADTKRVDAFDALLREAENHVAVYGPDEDKRMAYSMWTIAEEHCCGPTLRESLDNLIVNRAASSTQKEGTSDGN